jgi:HK97 gp10 family phage protein
MTAVLTGDKETNRKLATLIPRIQKRVLRQASRKALRPVAAAAKRNAPKDTGRLSRSLKIRAIKRSRRFFGSRITTTNKAGPAQEYGTKDVDETEFMQRAARQKKRSALTIYKAEAGKGIEAEARKNA